MINPKITFEEPSLWQRLDNWRVTFFYDLFDWLRRAVMFTLKAIVVCIWIIAMCCCPHIGIALFLALFFIL